MASWESRNGSPSLSGDEDDKCSWPEPQSGPQLRCLSSVPSQASVPWYKGAALGHTVRTEWWLVMWAHLSARSGQRAPPVTLLTSCLTLSIPWPLQILWTFSIYLESVAILPQLFMVSKTGEAETITSHYLFALGVYRTLYLFNWIWRYHFEGFFDLIAIVAGLVQTVLYCDFFYLYITKGNQDAGLAERPALFPVLYSLGPGSFFSQISPRGWDFLF